MGANLDSMIWVLALIFSNCTLTTTTYLISSLALFCLVITLLYWAHPGGPAWGKYRLTHTSSHTIPGPKGYPLIGSMELMTGLAHRKIAAMAARFGAQRLMAFSLGQTRVIVTCHADVAKEILQSPNFVNRPAKESAYTLMFNRAIGFAPYGAYWRALRRVAANHMFSPRQIKASESQRNEIALEMVGVFHSSVAGFRVRDVLRRASLSNMIGSVFGLRYGLDEKRKSERVEEIEEMVGEGYDLLGLLNWSDHLPFLSDFDFQKIRFRCAQLVPKVNRLVSDIIADHRSSPAHPPRDFVDVLLSLQGFDKLSDSDMIAVLWEMIFRGTDTVAVLIEWIAARLVMHPEVQDRVHKELDIVVGRSRALTESHIPLLVYLTAVIKEVLRLHPPGPLLSWSRLTIEDTTVDGHHVSAGTTAMVDMWAIARDPNVWPHPDTFDPDRFLTSDPSMEFSVLGSDLRLAPFGSGRRVCPGKALGLATVTFWVGTLLHEFKWASHDGEVDLSEVLKLSCEMANPLVVKVQSRRPFKPHLN